MPPIDLDMMLDDCPALVDVEDSDDDELGVAWLAQFRRTPSVCALVSLKLVADSISSGYCFLRSLLHVPPYL